MSPSQGPRRGFDARAVWALTEKEFLDNVRNRWILALSAIFLLLTLVISYLGATQTGGGAGFQGLSDTVVGMTAAAAILVPILGLMISYAAVVGEKERGSMLLLLSMPITRFETILGKFLGLGAVLLTAILAGLGIGGVVAMAFAGTEGWENFLVFLLGAALFALAFLSVGLVSSTVAKRRGTALGLAVFLWFFFAFIFDLALRGVLVATGGSFIPQPGETIPYWFYAVSIANPVDAFQSFAARAFGITSAFGFPLQLPAFVTVATTGFSLAVWASLPVVLAFWRFRSQDLYGLLDHRPAPPYHRKESERYVYQPAKGPWSCSVPFLSALLPPVLHGRQGRGRPRSSGKRETKLTGR